jgi:ubiquinone/menaquinone biosynthesis C-methylase UbiE
MSLRQNLVGQFKKPHGALGSLAGFIMANRQSNVERNEWTIDLLSLQSTDRLLELGYGPGIAIHKAAEVITEGLIVGVDHSQTMLKQASNRNARAIQQGLVQLYACAADALPSFDKPFDKICSANVVQFWPDPVAQFKLLRSILAPEGVIATTFMPRNSKATTADAFKKADTIVAQLMQAGFTSIHIEEKRLAPVSAISVVAENAPV